MLPKIELRRVVIEHGRGCLKLSMPLGLETLQIDVGREYAVTLTPLPTQAERERRGKVEEIIRIYGDDAFEELEAAGLLK